MHAAIVWVAILLVQWNIIMLVQNTGTVKYAARMFGYETYWSQTEKLWKCCNLHLTNTFWTLELKNLFWLYKAALSHSSTMQKLTQLPHHLHKRIILSRAVYQVYIGVANGTQKIVDLGNFWSNLEISETFMTSHEVSFFMCFFRSRSLEFFSQGLGVSDLLL